MTTTAFDTQIGRHIARPGDSVIHAGGVDLADADRLHALMIRSEGRLIDRISRGEEHQVLSADRGETRRRAIAVAFGIKEAVIKAAGGMPVGGRFVDTNASALIRRACRGSHATADVTVRGALADRLQELVGVFRAHGSVTWVTPTLALCAVLILGVAT